MNPPDLESLLRAAPRPTPPANLRDRLQQSLKTHRAPVANGQAATGGPGWFRRWWPTLVLGGAGLATAAALWVQEQELSELRPLANASTEAAVANSSRSIGAHAILEAAPGNSTVEDKRAEIIRLRQEVEQLRAALAAAEHLAAENRTLASQVAAQSGLSSEDLAAIQTARDRAMSITCINNLKQIGLALRIWATDHADTFPADLLSVTNELSTPKILACPSDPARQPATDWASYGPANLSYEFLAPNGTDADPQRVAARCLIHGHVLLSDGSVQSSQGDGSNLTRHLVTRDGKLYFQ